jgi:hypothetical protein
MSSPDGVVVESGKADCLLQMLIRRLQQRAIDELDIVVSGLPQSDELFRGQMGGLSLNPSDLRVGRSDEPRLDLCASVYDRAVGFFHCSKLTDAKLEEPGADLTEIELCVCPVARIPIERPVHQSLLTQLFGAL